MIERSEDRRWEENDDFSRGDAFVDVDARAGERETVGADESRSSVGKVDGKTVDRWSYIENRTGNEGDHNPFNSSRNLSHDLSHPSFSISTYHSLEIVISGGSSEGYLEERRAIT